ncbi:hypothetical protein GQ57_30375 [Burkholderia sp. MSh2]|nr:hypothetical protein GQ57_30375 [Burkholderia sp. MSh2]
MRRRAIAEWHSRYLDECERFKILPIRRTDRIAGDNANRHVDFGAQRRYRDSPDIGTIAGKP